MDDRTLMKLHVCALFTHDVRGRLCRVNVPNGKAAPRFFLGRTNTGDEVRFRYDLPDVVVEELQALCVQERSNADTALAPLESAACARILERFAPVRAVWTGPTYRCPQSLRASKDVVPVTHANVEVLQPHFEDWLDTVGDGRPFVAVLLDDRAVSVCASVRVTPDAHEAGVETAPDFRGRGYGRQAVAAWAKAVNDLGCAALYSTSWQNMASRALARALALPQYGSVLHIT
jgi:RimJ/RimL family protein N-acetyltransferase